jgi:hypothetical protein
MVIRLAEALEVPLRDRNAMLLAAGYAPAYRETKLDDPELGAVRTALERILDGHLPYAAVITDRGSNLVSANQAFLALIGDSARSPDQPDINVARVLLHPDGLARRILNLEEWGRHVIDGLRRKSMREPSAPLADLIEELEHYVPAHPPSPSSAHLGFAVPLRLRSDSGELTLLTTLSHFATATDVTISELTLEAFIPADDTTAAHFEELSQTSVARCASSVSQREGSGSRDGSVR